MTIAEIHGKSPLTTSEDMLTANVFTAFRYLPARMGIIGFLRSIKGVGDVIPEPASKASAAYFFWPRGKTREPDVLLELRVDGTLYHVVVEAKYLSGASDRELEEIEEKEEMILQGNQLADQMRELAAGEYMVWRKGRPSQSKRLTSEAENRLLLYLTAHPVRPRTTLRKSTALYPEGASRLFWSSWYHVSDYLHEQASALREFPYDRIVSDILTLLAQKQFKTFQGVRPFPAQLASSGDGRFWRGRTTPLPTFEGIQKPRPALASRLRPGFWKEQTYG